MSTLKVTHLQNENGTGPAMSLAVGGGVTFAGITTFHSDVDFGSATNLQVGTGATISGSTNTITASTNGEERLSINSNGGTIISNAGTFPSSTNETLNVQGEGHNGHGTSNTRSVFNVTGAVTSNTNGAGLWIGARTNENTAVIGTRTASGNLAIETFNSGWGERFRITSAGNVGIGTDNPSVPLHIVGTNGLIVEDSTNRKLGDLRCKNDIVELNAYDPANSNAGVPIVFKHYTSELGRFTSDGLQLASGKGINFHNYGTGTNIDSNLLDDYEEGTFTVTMQSANNNATISTNHTTGYYIKVGGKVSFTYYTSVSSCSNAGTGGARLKGLPFTSSNSTSEYWVCSVSHNGAFFSNTIDGGYVANGNTEVVFQESNTTITASFAIGSNRYLMVSGTYSTV